MKLNIIHMSFSPTYRLRLSDGRYIYMTWHRYCGPEFFHDKNCMLVYSNWWDDEQIVEALEWFQKRGCVA
tara:strand:+ start:23185 stop:23394 length:210 start_codon:yes stop_codon:yes gene_type:complete